MANALTFGACHRLEAELCVAPLLPRFQGWHGQHEHAIPVGRIGQYAVHRLWQSDVTVVGAHRPLRDQGLWLLLARAAIGTAYGEPVAADGHGNILRLQPRERRSKDKAISGLMELHGDSLL